MGSIGAPELIVIVVLALLLFGAGRIADIGKGLGQGIKNFKQGLKEVGDEDEEEEEEPKKAPAKKAKKAAAAKKAKDDDEEEETAQEEA